MIDGLINTEPATFSFFRKVLDLFKAGRAKSLTDYARNTRCEPIVVVDRGLVNYQYTHDIMLSMTSLMAGYLMQAIASSATIGNIEVNKHLERFNPTRNPTDNALDTAGTLLSMESMRLCLPGVLSMEAGAGRDADQSASGLGRDNIRDITTLDNLSVGKMFTVEIRDNNHVAAIPMSVRLIARDSTPENITLILSAGGDLKTVSERFEGLTMKRLAFWRDIVYAQDQIEAHRARAMGDNTGVYLEARKRASGNFWSGLLSFSPSVATASNVFVITKETATQLEGKIAGRLSDFRTREKLFDSMYVFFLVVVDTEWDRITIYTRDIQLPNNLQASKLKSINKGTGPNVAEVLSAYQLGRSPTL